MRRWSLLESYALLVCLLMLVCFLVALYYLGLGVIAREAPEYTINSWSYRSHQTNERYWLYASLGDRRPRPPEEALTAERERSWRTELQLERRDGTRSVWMSSFGAVASSVIFLAHWRVARRARRERRTRIAPFISGEIEGGFQSRYAKARRHQSSEWCHFFLKLARFSMLPLLHRVEQPQADLWRNRRHREDSADRAEAEIRIENGARAREHRKGGRHDVSKLREERRISA